MPYLLIWGVVWGQQELSMTHKGSINTRTQGWGQILYLYYDGRRDIVWNKSWARGKYRRRSTRKIPQMNHKINPKYGDRENPEDRARGKSWGWSPMEILRKIQRTELEENPEDIRHQFLNNVWKISLTCEDIPDLLSKMFGRFYWPVISFEYISEIYWLEDN